MEAEQQSVGFKIRASVFAWNKDIARMHSDGAARGLAIKFADTAGGCAELKCGETCLMQLANTGPAALRYVALCRPCEHGMLAALGSEGPEP